MFYVYMTHGFSYGIRDVNKILLAYLTINKTAAHLSRAENIAS